MHLKRRASPKIWPVAKKGTKYLVVPYEKGIPVLIAIREMLGLAQTAKEVKKMIHDKLVFVNSIHIRDEKYSLKLFDVLKLKDQNYRIIIKNKKFYPEKITEKEAKTKIAKIIGKKLLQGKKIQVNLDDGRNYISKEKANTGDSILIDFKEGIKKIIPLKEKSKVMVKSGKHIGKTGIIEKIAEKLAEIKTDSEKINVNLESLVAIE